MLSSAVAVSWIFVVTDLSFSVGGTDLVSRSKLKTSLAVFCWLRGCSRSFFCWIPSCDFPWSSELRWLRKTRPSANESTENWALNVVNREIYLALFLRESFSRREEVCLQTAASATAADLAVSGGFRVSHCTLQVIGGVEYLSMIRLSYGMIWLKSQ